MSVVLLCRVCSTSTPWHWCTWTLSQRTSSSPSLTATVPGPLSPALQKSLWGSKDHSFCTRSVGVMILLPSVLLRVCGMCNNAKQQQASGMFKENLDVLRLKQRRSYTMTLLPSVLLRVCGICNNAKQQQVSGMFKENLDVLRLKQRRAKRPAVAGNRIQDTWLVQPVLCH